MSPLRGKGYATLAAQMLARRRDQVGHVGRWRIRRGSSLLGGSWVVISVVISPRI